MKRIFLFLFICFFLTSSLFIYVNYYNQEKNDFQVIFFDIGQGDAALIKFNNDEKMLVDCGADKEILTKLGTRLSFYDQTIDYLLITHFDLDHYGGCIDVLKRYEVKYIITNGQKKEGDNYSHEWAKVRQLEQAKEYIISQPQVWQVGQANLEFLNPDPSLIKNIKLDIGICPPQKLMGLEDATDIYLRNLESELGKKGIRFYIMTADLVDQEYISSFKFSPKFSI